ncbi:RNA-directed DNA polymerase, eukaryota [Tanacetum coccineum]
MDPVTVKQEIFKHFDNRFNNCSNTRIEYNNDVVYPVTLTQDQQGCKVFFRSGRFPKGCNPSFIALIPKVNDTKFVKDFHPISLIGCQYKIVGKILANRLSRVIGRLVSKEQSAFICGRQILDGPMILSEVIEWCNQKKKKAMIFKVDFEKAYDSVRWDFLDMIMLRFGFGDTWRDWIKGCLISSSASILVNGSPTNEFRFQQGLRQGDPLSSFFFVGYGIFAYFLCSSNGSSLVGVGGVKYDDVSRGANLVRCDATKTPFKYLGVMIIREVFVKLLLDSFGSKHQIGIRADVIEILVESTMIQLLSQLGVKGLRIASGVTARSEFLLPCGRDGTILRVPRKFQGYETSEEEPVEQPRRHDLYGFVDHPQLQQGNPMNEFAPHRLPQPKGNMNGWLIEDEEEVERNEVDSDLESTASSKPVWKKTTKADHDRASRGLASMITWIIVDALHTMAPSRRCGNNDNNNNNENPDIAAIIAQQLQTILPQIVTQVTNNVNNAITVIEEMVVVEMEMVGTTDALSRHSNLVIPRSMMGKEVR